MSAASETDPLSARIVDPAIGDDVATGEAGELLLHNPATTPGYFGMLEETAAVLRGGWLHTGDLAGADEAGNLYFAGRVKEMIRRRRENLSPADVEVVLDAHPAVSSSAVIGVPSPLTEEDVKAFVLVRPGADVSAVELRDWCAERLPLYKRPRYVEFIGTWAAHRDPEDRQEAAPDRAHRRRGRLRGTCTRLERV